jgi:UDPglucose 6-dehydrogenase
MRMMVLGVGHVGLVTAATMASIGHRVIGLDVDDAVIGRLRRCEMPFFEPGLDELVRRGVVAGRLSFRRSEDPVPDADVLVVCVGRPSDEDGEDPGDSIKSLARQLAPLIGRGTLVAVKSTMVPGTCDQLASDLAALTGKDVDVVSNPEFLREGMAVADSIQPWRIVVGASSADAFARMRRVYAPLVRSGVELIEVDRRTAELAKLASNAFLATKISFANMLARMSAAVGADVRGLGQVLGSDPRIGSEFLTPGLGFGGGCLPKDISTLVGLSTNAGSPASILTGAIEENQAAVTTIIELIEVAARGLSGRRVALLGLSFKPETDDLRNAPAVALADRLRVEGATVSAFDPVAWANAHGLVDGLRLEGDPYAACEGADVAVLCTEWDELLDLDVGRLRAVMGTPAIVDGRCALDRDLFERAGFEYFAPGSRVVAPALQGLPSPGAVAP